MQEVEDGGDVCGHLAVGGDEGHAGADPVVRRARVRPSRSAPRRSAAWHSASRWIAATFSVRATTSHVLGAAAIVPMETLSWLWASVEREWMLAGISSFNASAVSAEHASCIPLKP